MMCFVCLLIFDAFYHKLVCFCFGFAFGFTDIAFSNTANCIVSNVTILFLFCHMLLVFVFLLHSFSEKLMFVSRDFVKLIPTNGSFSMKVSRKVRSTYWRTFKDADPLNLSKLVTMLDLLLMQVLRIIVDIQI
jgi:hypothetical protein